MFLFFGFWFNCFGARGVGVLVWGLNKIPGVGEFGIVGDTGLACA